MKWRLQVAAIVGVLAAFPAVVSAQNLLMNGGLELVPPDAGGQYHFPPGWQTLEGPAVPAAPGPYPGDYNQGGASLPCGDVNTGCGAVDTADYVMWRKHLGETFTLPNEGITPGVVNDLDYIFWKRHFGEPLPISLAEPSNFTHILETFAPNPPAPDADGEWQYWFQPYYGTFANQLDNFADLYQDVPGTPGLQYTMTGWAMGEQVFPGGVTNLNAESGGTPTGAPFDDGPLSPTDIFFALEFLNGSGTVLAGSVVKELKNDLGFANSGDPDLVGYLWQQFTLIGVAPAGTVTVRVRASMTDGVVNPTPAPQSFRMSFFVDEFSLTAGPAGSGNGAGVVPEPATWMLLATAIGAVVAQRRRWLLAQASCA